MEATGAPNGVNMANTIKDLFDQTPVELVLGGQKIKVLVTHQAPEGVMCSVNIIHGVEIDFGGEQSFMAPCVCLTVLKPGEADKDGKQMAEVIPAFIIIDKQLSLKIKLLGVPLQQGDQDVQDVQTGPG